MQDLETSDTELFTGNGEMAELLRSKKWEETPMGPVEQWPESLKTSLRIILHSPYPMFIWWGPDLLMFHNDAYLPVLGKKHPEALGMSARDGWAEIWGDVGRLAARVMKGESAYAEDLPLYLDRKGFAEETYWTFAYSPIFRSDGKVGGLFCACNEATRKIIQQRRLQTLIDISSTTTRHSTVDALLQHSMEVFDKKKADIPFAAVYLVDANGEKASLHSSCGVNPSSMIFDKSVSLTEKSPRGWDFRGIDTGNDIKMRHNLRSDFGPAPYQTGSSADQAAILPIWKAGEQKVAAILICGISPHLEFDSEYSEFIKLIATNISQTKADIRSREIMQQRAQVLAEADEAKTAALKNLRQAQERLHAMIMQAPIAMTILKGEDLVFEIANKYYLEIIDKTADQILHKPVLEALPEVKGQPIEEILGKVYSEGKTFTAHEYPVDLYRNAKEETAYITFVYEPMRDLNGRVNGIMVVCIDQTPQVEARQLLEKREQYFRNMANDVPVMIWMLDTEGNCTYLNSQWLDYTGQSHTEGMGKGWLEPVHPDDREEAENTITRALAEPDYLEVTYRLKDAKGNYYWHLEAGLPRYDSNGKFEGFTGAVVKIHERKLAEDALKQSESELRSAISATNMGTWVHYPRTGDTNWSARSKELFGLPPNAPVNHEVFLNALHPDDRDRTNRAVSRALDPGIRAPYDIEYRTIDSEGKLRWLRDTGQAFFDDTNEASVFIGTLLDITEQKALEKQKDDFLAIASHELKTPVTSIKGYIQILEEELRAKNEPEAAARLNTVDRQVGKLVRLVNELLDASKVGSGALELNKSVFKFDDLLQEVINSLQLLSNHKLVYRGRTGRSVFGDRHRIEQVMVNLITNAIKFSPEADAVHITTEVKNQYIVLRVKDFGVGIKAENKTKIFDQFYRDTETGKWSPGLGLGLFISSDIIKRHKGSIHVESEPGKGSEFEIKLPCENC